MGGGVGPSGRQAVRPSILSVLFLFLIARCHCLVFGVRWRIILLLVFLCIEYHLLRCYSNRLKQVSSKRNTLLDKITIKVQSWIVNYFHYRIVANYCTFPSPLTLVQYALYSKYYYPPTTIPFCKLFSQYFSYIYTIFFTV